ncbi:MAG: HAD hydrolase-like protein [Gammaproteobacteria bacterium]|nr:HAD hydrolase-like protein [Gammaproteobacteria bacterium]
MPRALRIIFDLDDTLYPERSFALSGFRAAAEWARREWAMQDKAGDMAEEMIALLDAGHLGGLFKISLKRHLPEASDEDLAQLIEIYRRHRPDIELFEDAARALDVCAELGPLGLITDGTAYLQQNKVRALGIAERFVKILYTGALGEARAFYKPHPKAYESMEAALPGAGAHFVYVGDNPKKDFITPNRRGWTTVQVRRDHGIHDAYAVAQDGVPQHIIDSLDELQAVLLG